MNRFFIIIGRYFVWVGQSFVGLCIFWKHKLRSRMLATAIYTQFAIVIVLSLILIKLTPFGFGSFLAAAAIWTWVLCFTPAFDLWFIQPKANAAAVLANPLKRERLLKTDAELTKLQPSDTMRVLYGPTLDGKYPWEELVNGQVINTLRSVELKGTANCITSDGVPVRFPWLGYLSVIQSDRGIMNLVRNSEKKIVDSNTARAEAYIKTQVFKISFDDLFNNIYREDEKTGRGAHSR